MALSSIWYSISLFYYIKRCSKWYLYDLSLPTKQLEYSHFNCFATHWLPQWCRSVRYLYYYNVIIVNNRCYHYYCKILILFILQFTTDKKCQRLIQILKKYDGYLVYKQARENTEVVYNTSKDEEQMGRTVTRKTAILWGGERWCPLVIDDLSQDRKWTDRKNPPSKIRWWSFLTQPTI